MNASRWIVAALCLLLALPACQRKKGVQQSKGVEDCIADMETALAMNDGKGDPVRFQNASGSLVKVATSAAVPALRKGLVHASPKIRLAMASVLGNLGPHAAPACPELQGCLQDSDPAVRSAAARCLGRIGPHARAVVPALTAATRDPEPAVRVQAISALVLLGAEPKELLPMLCERLGDKDPGVREAAALGLAALGASAKEAVPILAAAVRAGGDLCWPAVLGLLEASPGGVEAVDPMKDALGDPGPRVRSGAAKVLGLIGSAARPASAALVQGLSDPDAGVRLASAWALGRVDPGEAAAAPLEKALGDTDRLVRIQAAETLARLGKALEEARKVFVLELKAAMADISSTANRNLVVWATEKFSTLGIPPGEIVAALSSALGNEDLEDEPEILVEILTILRGIGPAAKEAVPAASGLLGSSDYDKVIVACAGFLGSLGKESRGAVRVLIDKGLKDKDFEKIRQACAEALGAIGPEANKALPLLEDLASKDRFPDVRKAAEEAIGKIR